LILCGAGKVRKSAKNEMDDARQRELSVEMESSAASEEAILRVDDNEAARL